MKFNFNFGVESTSEETKEKGKHDIDGKKLVFVSMKLSCFDINFFLEFVALQPRNKINFMLTSKFFPQRIKEEANKILRLMIIIYL